MTNTRRRKYIITGAVLLYVQVEQVNEEWQQYAEQRDQYARVLAQRCAELEQSHSRCSMPSSGAFTDEQQRKIDRLLLNQRHKTELAEEARSRVRAMCTGQ